MLPKLSDLGQGAIGEAIEAAGAWQFGRLLVSEAVFLSLTARDASTKPNVQRSGRMSIATAQRPFGECRSTAAPETFSRDTAFSGLGGFGIFRLSLLKMLKLRCNRENVEEA